MPLMASLVAPPSHSTPLLHKYISLILLLYLTKTAIKALTSLRDNLFIRKTMSSLFSFNPECDFSVSALLTFSTKAPSNVSFVIFLTWEGLRRPRCRPCYMGLIDLGNKFRDFGLRILQVLLLVHWKCNQVMTDPMTNPMTLEIRITFIHKNQCPWNIYYYLEPVLLLTFRTVWNTYQCYLKLTEKHVRDDTVLLNSLNTK